jgi:hypothetical protein
LSQQRSSKHGVKHGKRWQTPLSQIAQPVSPMPAATQSCASLHDVVGVGVGGVRFGQALMQDPVWNAQNWPVGQSTV